MSDDPKEILKKIDDDEYLGKFIEQAQTAITADMNQTRVASEVLLSRTIFRRSAALSDTLQQVSKEVTRSVKGHAKVMEKSGDAAEQHARSLKRATWALFVATLILAAVAALNIIFQLNG